MAEPDICPHCGAIDQTVGVEVRGQYDGILYWEHPGCGGRWHRWPEGHYLRARAWPYVGEP